jgi:Flp pilus assembly protein TadD
LAIAAALVAGALAVYAQVGGHGFVNLDDQQYVYDNPFVRLGLIWDGLAWAFGFRATNWHPLTWLSHMLDVELFGLDAGRHHLVSVAIHSLNTVLVFLWLRQMTGATWRSAVVAAFFGLHPLHVESVAWISERKDVLYALFWLLGSMAWVQWTRRGGAGRYLLVVVLFALGLAAKPMAVTFPFALLLLDGWPLGRASLAHTREETSGRTVGALVREKTPLFALSAASVVLTWLAQRGTAAVRLESISLGARLANGVVAYVAYLRDAVWPAALGPFYPHPSVASTGHPGWLVAACAAGLAAVTFVALRERSRRPFLLWGWLWYLGLLVPVIGLVQVGLQSRADRYTYLPLLGLFVAITWEGAAIAGTSRTRRAIAATVTAIALLAFALVAHSQVRHWRDSEAIWIRALAVTEGNWQAWRGLGDALADAGRHVEATAAHRQALQIRPTDAEAWNALGADAGRRGDPGGAVPLLEQALRLDPRLADAWYNLGTAQGNLGRHVDAEASLARAVELRPDHGRAWANLAVARVANGDRAGAERALRCLDRLDGPGSARLRASLGVPDP